MKSELKRFLQLIAIFFKAFFTFKKKVWIFSIPSHPNLGDQAQLMCTEKWVRENYDGCKIIKMGHLFMPFSGFGIKKLALNVGFWQHLVLKMVIREDDVFIGHSGYFFVDHHGGWYSYDYLLRYWANKFIILPQTVNFYAPVVKRRFSDDFGNKSNLTLLCRDEVSYNYAKEMLGTTRLLLYPDIVTSLIGTREYKNPRDGVLFCMRDDIEAFYSPADIDSLMQRFGNIRKEKVDTTLQITEKEMRLHRDSLINAMIEKVSTFEVVVTDRYHGTIFSAIASTPVVVINSADHKLRSGVKWFPKEFGLNVQFANSLEEAYQKTSLILEGKEHMDNPPYFKENYWDKLFERLS